MRRPIWWWDIWRNISDRTIDRTMRISLLSFAVLAMTASQCFAHHSIAAQYDDKKPTTLKGIVTKFDWTNPHVFVFVDVTAANGETTTWGVEFPSRVELKRAGW